MWSLSPWKCNRRLSPYSRFRVPKSTRTHTHREISLHSAAVRDDFVRDWACAFILLSARHMFDKHINNFHRFLKHLEIKTTYAVATYHSKLLLRISANFTHSENMRSKIVLFKDILYFGLFYNYFYDVSLCIAHLPHAPSNCGSRECLCSPSHEVSIEYGLPVHTHTHHTHYWTRSFQVEILFLFFF